MYSIDELTDACWVSMRGSLFRRAILGRQRCSELVLMTLAQFPDANLIGVTQHSAADRKVRAALASQVEAAYRSKDRPHEGTYGAVFMTIVLAWAVKLIVAYLINAWFSQQFSIADIRRQYGWKHG